VRTPLQLVLLLALVLRATPAAGQVRQPALQEYRFVSEAGYASAIWVNPGASGFNRPIHLIGHMTGDRPEGSDWSLAQYLIGFQWEVVSFGYQHDEFSGVGFEDGDAYTVSGGVESGGNGIGVSYTWRTVGQADGNFDVGWLYQGGGNASLGVVWQNIGAPEVRDTTLDEQLVAGVTARPSEGRFGLSLQAAYRTKKKDFGAFRIGGTLTLMRSLQALALVQWSGDGDFEGFMIGAIWRGRSMVAGGAIGLSSGGDARTASGGLDFWSQRQR
jgi:hypothetical protein